MLIIIDAAVANLSSATLADPRLRESVDNLCIAHRKGLHVVAGSPHALRTIGRYFGGDIEGTLRQVAGRHHELTSIKDAVKEYVQVEARDDRGVEREMRGDHLVYRVPYPWFDKYEAVMPSRLVTEDADDRDVYVAVLNAYRFVRKAELRGLRCMVQGFGGGGSSTEDQFRDHAGRGPTLAVADSDMRGPISHAGATARALVRAADKLATTTVSRAELTPCHEIENILPAQLVSDCLTNTDGPELRKAWLQICEGDLLNGHADVRFVDLKRGIRRYDVLHGAAQDVAYLHPIAARFPIRIPCQPDAVCGSRDLCTCVHVTGLGDAVLKRVTTAVARMSLQKVAEYFFSPAHGGRDLVVALCERMFGWACATEPSRT